MSPANMAYAGLPPDRPEAWPKSMTPGDFAQRFAAESDTLEFKQGLSALQESIVAFSNTLGGVIVTGVANDGRVVGLPYSSAVEDKIRDAARSTHSPASVAVRGLEVDGKQVTIIGVG